MVQLTAAACNNVQLSVIPCRDYVNELVGKFSAQYAVLPYVTIGEKLITLVHMGKNCT